MSILGKILAFLNILGLLGFGTLAGMTYAKRRAWQYQNFRHDLLAGDAGQPARHFIAHQFAGKDVGPLGRDEAANASRRLFEQRVSSEQLQQLLGALSAAERPEPRAAAARHDHGVSMRQTRISAFRHATRWLGILHPGYSKQILDNFFGPPRLFPSGRRKSSSISGT